MNARPHAFALAAVLITLAVVMSCTPAVQDRRRDVETTGPTTTEDIAEVERGFDPLGLSPTDLDNVPARGLPERFRGGGVGDTTRLTVDQAAMSMGFRVQVSSGRSQGDAAVLASRVRGEVGQSVYVVLDGDLYKVRVGDCPTPECATVLRDSLRTLGYIDAWIVKTKILAP